ncbi:MAG: GxxExxY protein [Chitinispirillaceae bacterium]|nr:GxxExxY protein [Chitinispirillaceae bacterium]
MPDFICFKKIIIELKACNDIVKEHKAQVFNCLKVNKLQAWITCKIRQLSKGNCK